MTHWATEYAKVIAEGPYRKCKNACGRTLDADEPEFCYYCKRAIYADEEKEFMDEKRRDDE